MDTTLTQRSAGTFVVHSFSSQLEKLLALVPAGRRRERLDRLVAHFKTLPAVVRSSEANREAARVVEDIIAATKHRYPRWGDIDAVDHALLVMCPEEDLDAVAGPLRADFRRATGLTNGKSASDTTKGGERADHGQLAGGRLRADLLEVQKRLQEAATDRRIQMRARNTIACWTVALGAAAIALALQLDKIFGQETIIYDLFAVGVLGGLFSTLQRVQNFRLGGEREAIALNATGNKITVILAPVLGGAGAILLFALLAAGYLKGFIFPEITKPDSFPDSGALEHLFEVRIPSFADTARLYLLCFLAGFSERLVPDVMSRLAASAQQARTEGRP